MCEHAPPSWVHLIARNGITYYYNLNGHGDVVSLSDSNGNIVAEYQYDAWGNILSQSGIMATINPYRYAGYRYDEITGLYYLTARYYNAGDGRFITKDTLEGKITNPLSLNLYTYTANNPLKCVDPSGYTYTWALNLISKGYNKGYYNSANASLMIFGSSALSFLAPDMSAPTSTHFYSLFTPFHEIAQINVARALYRIYGSHPTLELKLKTDYKGLFKQKYYEADIVLGKQVWEVKPKGGADPKPQLELYKRLGNLREGNKLKTISGIVILGNVRMKIEFPNAGEALYSFYEITGNGQTRNMSTVGAAIAVGMLLLRSFPAGRRLAPGF